LRVESEERRSWCNAGDQRRPARSLRALLDRRGVFQFFLEAVGLQLALVHAVGMRLRGTASCDVSLPAVRGIAAAFVISCSSF